VRSIVPCPLSFFSLPSVRGESTFEFFIPLAESLRDAPLPQSAISLFFVFLILTFFETGFRSKGSAFCTLPVGLIPAQTVHFSLWSLFPPLLRHHLPHRLASASVRVFRPAPPLVRPLPLSPQEISVFWGVSPSCIPACLMPHPFPARSPPLSSGFLRFLSEHGIDYDGDFSTPPPMAPTWLFFLFPIFQRRLTLFLLEFFR